VQAPQDYRDEADNLFKAMCYAEYRGFFLHRHDHAQPSATRSSSTAP